MDLRDLEALEKEGELWKAVGWELYPFALALRGLPEELQETFLAELPARMRERIKEAQEEQADASAAAIADALSALLAQARRVRSGASLH